MSNLFPSGPQSRDVSGDLAVQRRDRVGIHKAVHAEAQGKLGGDRLMFSAFAELNVDKLFGQYAPDVVVDALQREVQEQRKVSVEEARRIVFSELLTAKQKFVYLGFPAEQAEQLARAQPQ